MAFVSLNMRAVNERSAAEFSSRLGRAPEVGWVHYIYTIALWRSLDYGAKTHDCTPIWKVCSKDRSRVYSMYEAVNVNFSIQTSS